MARGDAESAERLATAVIDDLRRIARREMSVRHHRPLEALTIEPAMLAGDALMKIFDGRPEFGNRRHFFAYATQVMVRALVDYQRQRQARKRGGGLVRVTLSGVGQAGDGALGEPALDVEALPPILAHLAELDPRKAEVVQLRVFWGMTIPEIAEVLETSPSTIDRDWRFAKRWLATELRPAVNEGSGADENGLDP